MKRIIYLMMALICAVSINAQVTIGDNTDPHSGAVLELKGDKGLLLPRVSLSSATVFQLSEDEDTAQGMMVYNTNENFSQGVGAYVWDGSQWTRSSSTSSSGGSWSGGNGGSRTSDCGAVVDGCIWLPFMCHNLGADETANPFEPSAAIHGAKYIWGAKTPIITQAVDQANASAPAGWTTPTANADGSWTDRYKAANDPCPDGWRVPTSMEWQLVITNNTISKVGDWTNSATNFSSGMYIGNYLFLPAAGNRTTNGLQSHRGSNGLYWSSTILGTSTAYCLHFTSDTSPMAGQTRTIGKPIRCVAE